MEQLLKIFELASYVVTVVGLPVAIATFLIQKRKDRAAEEEKTFHQLDDSYILFQKLCLDHPDLDIFDPPIGESYKPNEEQIRRESAIFGIQISMFERAHIMFRDKSKDFRANQWAGWEEYIKSYCYRHNFQREWKKIGSQFDKVFYKYMDSLMGDAVQGKEPT